MVVGIKKNIIGKLKMSISKIASLDVHKLTSIDAIASAFFALAKANNPLPRIFCQDSVYTPLK